MHVFNYVNQELFVSINTIFFNNNQILKKNWEINID
jgi:hypothetical protein